jgi:shikimate kinase
MNSKKNIALIGMAGVGKTTIAKHIAQKLGYDCIEVDQIITKLAKMKGKDKETLSDNEFMDFERKAIFSLNDRINSVIDTGGSTVYSKEAMNILKNNSFIVYLSDYLENIEKRFKERGEMHLIGMTPEKSFKKLFNERVILYKEFADCVVEVSAKDIESLEYDIIREYQR